MHGRARRVLQRGHATGLHDVERVGEHLAAEFENARRQGVDVLDRDVGGPVRRQRSALLLPHLVQRGHVLPFELEGRVRAGFTRRGVDRLPTEHAGVERLGGVGVGRTQVGPAERAGRVALALAHLRRAAYASRERPVISGGCSIPMSARIVGVTSARIPSPSNDTPSAVTIIGTGLSECAVLGDPSSSSMLSQLPWSAVITSAPPLSWTASTTRPRHSSTVSTAFTAASITPVWPTMSGFAKLMIPNAGASACQCSTNAAAASRALISGLKSYVGTSRGDGTSSRISPSYGFSSPPLKK